MKKIVVTGATSMIGVATINEAIKNNVEVLAIIRKDSKKIDRLPKSNLIKFLECDLDKFDTIDSVDDDYDVFYHFAWGNTDKNTRNDPVLQQKNIKYALDAVNLAKKLGCKKFIGAGSQAEYGRVEGKLNASTPINPDIAYGMAKYAAGRLTNLRCKEIGLEHIWVRILSVYGIYDGPNTMISYAIKELLAGKEPEFTKCQQKWDYLFSEDAGKAFYLIGEKGITNKIYCLGSGFARPLSEYVKTINRILGKSENTGIGKKVYAPNQVMYLEADISELSADTGFKPTIPFEEGLKKTIDWIRKEKIEN
jgi:nucleoside-diphosphate-sugar epimerase